MLKYLTKRQKMAVRCLIIFKNKNCLFKWNFVFHKESFSKIKLFERLFNCNTKFDSDLSG